jgi:hypothetical protein
MVEKIFKGVNPRGQGGIFDEKSIFKKLLTLWCPCGT